MTSPLLVIFDCDGVLVDSERLCVAVDSQLITETGWPITPLEVAAAFLGKSDDYMLSTIEREVGRPLGGPWLAELHQRYEVAFSRELTAVPGVPEVVDALLAAGVDICVASSGTHSKIQKTLGLTGLLTKFEGRIYSASEVANGKPAPDLFLHAARSMGFDPSDCVVVEDSPAGIEAAGTAGMRNLAFLTPLTQQVSLAGPMTTEFTDMISILDILGISKAP